MTNSPLKSALIACLFSGALQLSAQRARIDFNPDWSYRYGGKEHNATLPRAFNEDYAFKVAIEDLPTDTVRYTKTFRLPPTAKGKKVFIEFEGARQGATVFLNGKRLGMHENGVMAFGFDLTPFIDYEGENRIEVLTDNDWGYREKAGNTNSTFQWNNKNFNANYGGLPKNVFLHICGDVYQTLPLYSSLGTTGVYVYAKDINVQDNKATICAESEVKNESGKRRKLEYEVEILDMDGQSVACFKSEAKVAEKGETVTLSASGEVDGLNFWSWGYGYLYTVKTRVMVKGKCVDEVATRTGFRKTEFGEGMFKLNDRVMMVHGYAQRTSNEWPGVGMSVPAWLSDYSNGEMVRSGGNLVRWMHVAPWKQDVESCDRVGLIQAMPAGDAEKDVTGRHWEQRVELMRDAIIYNRNNPSVIFIECGNKGISEEHMAQMKELRDEFDPHGGRAIGSREMLGSKTSEYGGEMLYINKSKGQPVWAMEYCRDEGLRRYWDDWSYPYHKNGDGPLYRNADASAYNLNQDQLAVEHIRRWYDYWLVRPGTGHRVSSGGVKIVFTDTNTHCRGESNYRTSGVMDAMRLPKDSYYAHQVMWNGWVTPEQSQTYIMGHWNYPEDTVKPVYVVSDAPKVKLFLNGKEVGTEKTDYHFLHTFDSIAFEPGTLYAASYDKDGNELSYYSLKTAGEAAQLALSAQTAPGGMVADGADMAMIQFEVIDKNGQRCPLDNRNVSFSVEGPAEWRGGIAKGEGNCVLSTELPVECGVNRALIRSTTQAGKVTITARAEGLPEARLELTTIAANPSSAVAQAQTVFPFNPIRTSTPSTPSYTDIMRSVEVKSVTAGCNQETALNSIDDNEETEWKNDGKPSTAWISFELSERERIDEVSLKLTGWRRRSYPLEIFADNKLVWQGNTPMSLGYVNLPLTPVKASRITIRLKGAATDNEAFGQITELAAPVANELDLFKAKDGDKVRSELRIVEADFLQHIIKE